MEKPTIAATSPQTVHLEQGRIYAWCACGLSANQPFCNGSHKGSRFRPLVFKTDKDRDVAMCRCKHTKTPPYCDGSHSAFNTPDR